MASDSDGQHEKTSDKRLRVTHEFARPLGRIRKYELLEQIPLTVRNS